MRTNEETIAHIQICTEFLDGVANKLKTDFVGLDNIIDDIIKNIKVWYIFPEVQMRPSIICLWGLTGVGKTDLVRKLVSYLKFQDRFLEIEMKEGSDYTKSVQEKLECSSLEPENPCIVLFDEFQKFRTIEEDGESTENSSYSDVWTLLSDGKFAADIDKRTEILESVLYNKFNADEIEYESKLENIHTSKNKTKSKGKSKKNKPKKNYSAGDSLIDSLSFQDEVPKATSKKPSKSQIVTRNYYTNVYTAKRLKRLFKRPESVEVIMSWGKEQIQDIYNSSMSDPSIYEGDMYKKMLIFVSGNLDEAFAAARAVSEVDLDADFFHEFSKRINIIHIKDALKKRFRPEQIARLGNTHIIYPCLNKQNYYDILVKKCKETTQLVYNLVGIKITLDQAVYDIIYNNGVFPTQGVRPLLSTINNVLSTTLPQFIYTCLISNVNEIIVHGDGNKLYSDISGNHIEIEVNTNIDQIRKEKQNDIKYITLIHEMGHALIYSILFGVSPKRVCIDSVSNEAEGYILPHEIVVNKQGIQNKLRVLFAGRVAEEIIFGKDKISCGCVGDMTQISNYLMLYTSKYGFHEVLTQYSQQYTEQMPVNIDVSYNICKTLTEFYYKETKELFDKHIKLYKELVKDAITRGEFDNDEYINIFKKYGYELKDIKEGEIITLSYKEEIDQFLK